MVSPELPIPVALLAKVNREAKLIASQNRLKRSLWQALDDFIPLARESVEVDWPASVFMPFGLWPSFLERYYGWPARSFDLGHPIMRGMAQVLACLAPWRATQDIIRFDPGMEAELKGMDLAGKLPSDILLRLPAWAVFMDVPLTVDGDNYDGFFVQLDSHVSGVYLALTFQGPDHIQQRVPLALGDFTLDESLKAVNRFMKEPENVKANDRGLIQALNLVIYLCAYGLQERQDHMGVGVTYPSAKKIKKGWRILPPARPRTHVLGASFGESLRREGAGARGGGGAVRPHVRRPHWHHYWTGGADKKSLIVRWLPPIFVGDHERDEDGDIA